MIDGHKVTCWTPFGRERTVSILAKYMERDVKRGIVDEYILYMNTDDDQASDRAYGYQLAEEHDWIRIIERPERYPGPKQRSTGYFYRYATDPGTIYVRLDDDMVYLHESAVENLVRARIQMPAPTAVFPVIINNAICSHFLQNCGKVPREWGEVGMYCMDPNGWANGAFAVKLHELLLDHIERGRVEDLYLYQDFPIPPGTQFSVSCFASRGEHYAALQQPGVLVPDEEESWHTIHQPLKTSVPNILRGDAIVAHWSFQPQHAFLNITDLLDRYREIADKAVTA
ncbi:hypothetical protein [Streptomyces ipomoeae]|uniref:hypothetical protein n=1 Tax=Streptomyces ipomoeae TaxID=103232 RepID=UPI0029B9198C|nr:hypothetical protein [Streptomyces ipomoeae]MDX2697015.1 hypothetical protein [Streptomyces ipomoeae]